MMAKHESGDILTIWNVGYFDISEHIDITWYMIMMRACAKGIQGSELCFLGPGQVTAFAYNIEMLTNAINADFILYGI